MLSVYTQPHIQQIDGNKSSDGGARRISFGMGTNKIVSAKVASSYICCVVEIYEMKDFDTTRKRV